MRTLKAQGRYLAWDDGTPFFYLGDTAWELFHRLNREEMDHYFAERARQGFTAVQAVALAEFEGVTVPNAYGRLPLHFADGLPDPTSPDLDAGYSYWDHVDYAVEAAAQRRLFLVILPTWGDKFHLCWGKGPEIFDEANAYAYGKWIAARYRDKWNILWMLGGDRPLEPKHRAIVDAMAAGIREADANHLITFHPPGAKDSTDFLADAPYIDFHTAQTGHGIEQCYRSDEVMAKMAAATGKPYLDSEPRYEDHPACFNDRIGYFWNAQAGRAPERLLGRPGGRLRPHLRQPLHLEHDQAADLLLPLHVEGGAGAPGRGADPPPQGPAALAGLLLAAARAGALADAVPRHGAPGRRAGRGVRLPLQPDGRTLRRKAGRLPRGQAGARAVV